MWQPWKTSSTVKLMKIDCTWFHKVWLMSCVLREKRKKEKKKERRHAINPTMVKRSTWIGHLPPEVALCGLAALRSDRLRQTHCCRKKNTKKNKKNKQHLSNPEWITWRPNSVRTKIPSHPRNQARKKISSSPYKRQNTESCTNTFLKGDFFFSS